MRNRIVNIVLITILLFIFTLPLGHKANASTINLNVNGDTYGQTETLLVDGRTYIPVRDFSNLLNANVRWDHVSKRAIITKEKIELKLISNEARVIYNGQVYYMDSPVIIRNDRAYAPVRFISESFHYNVVWSSASNVVSLYSKATYLVKEGDTLSSISETTGVSVENLKKWNQLESDALYVNTKLLLEPLSMNAVDTLRTNAVVDFSDQELEWLARIVYLESRDEPYEGQVAVGAVVINRVQSSNFPNTIYDVIFAPGQFTPVRTGKIYETTPDADSYRAAKEALMGADPVNGALYFFNPDVSSSSFFDQKQHIKDIGNHSFYK